MNSMLEWMGLAALAFILGAHVTFLRTLLLEREHKGLRAALAILGPFTLILVGYLFLPSPVRVPVAILALLVPALVLAALLAPAPKPLHEPPIREIKRVDERDVIFSRWRYEPGTKTYREYYASHPEREAGDADLRRRPGLFAPGGIHYEPLSALAGRSEFEHLGRLTTLVDGPVAAQKREVARDDITARIKKLAFHLGAHSVGISSLDPAFVYSHVGRGPEPWGAPIGAGHTHAISFTVEQDFKTIRKAPNLATAVETGKRYVQGAVVSIVLAGFIRSLGYGARAHIEGSNYQAILPPLAERAGLGEVGRMSILMTEDRGPNVRLGLVTTDLELNKDEPKLFDAARFCEACLKCARACPSGAIPRGPREVSNGVRTWRINPDACYRTWRILGTDCGLCVAACPYTKPDTTLHRLVRRAVRRTGTARRLAVWADDLFYGCPGKTDRAGTRRP